MAHVAFNKSVGYCIRQTLKLHGMCEIHLGDSWWASQRHKQLLEKLKLRKIMGSLDED